MADEKQPFPPPYYWWWKTWQEGGKDYAHRTDVVSVDDAKRRHKHEMTFRWAEGLDRPHVSDLNFVSNRRVESFVEAGGWRDDPEKSDDSWKADLPF